jgi:hypothetical protein
MLRPALVRAVPRSCPLPSRQTRQSSATRPGGSRRRAPSVGQPRWGRVGCRPVCTRPSQAVSATALASGCIGLASRVVPTPESQRRSPGEPPNRTCGRRATRLTVVRLTAIAPGASASASDRMRGPPVLQLLPPGLCASAAGVIYRQSLGGAPGSGWRRHAAASIPAVYTLFLLLAWVWPIQLFLASTSDTRSGLPVLVLTLLGVALGARFPAGYFRLRRAEADGRIYAALGVRRFRSLVTFGSRPDPAVRFRLPVVRVRPARCGRLWSRTSWRAAVAQPKCPGEKHLGRSSALPPGTAPDLQWRATKNPRCKGERR